MSDNETKFRVRPPNEAKPLFEAKVTGLLENAGIENIRESVSQFVRYLFEPAETNLFISCAEYFKTPFPHDVSSDVNYLEWLQHKRGSQEGASALPGDRPEVEIKSQTKERVRQSLQWITDGIDALCEEGPRYNEVLQKLDSLYKQRLSVPVTRKDNLITELRSVIKEHKDKLVEIIATGRPSREDYLVEFLLCVFNKVLPMEVRGKWKLFCNIAQAAFETCFEPIPPQGEEWGAVGLESRVRECRKRGRVGFEYAAGTDTFVASAALKEESAL